jgi:DUF1680 family protein
MRYVVLIIVCFYCFSCKNSKTNSQGENFSENVNKVASTIVDDSDQLTFFQNPRQPLTPKFAQFPTGSVKPKGWILQMMQNDLNKGIVGALDELYPGISKDDLYNTARRGGMEDIPEMGDLVLTGAAWETSIMWWNAETIGNWWDGFIRHAFLTNNSKAIAQAHAIVNNLLASQDADGYIGIYKPNLRYQHEGSNGELWAQTTAFRAMLAYYEFTQKPAVLEAVEKAMLITMKRYGETSKNPFDLKNSFGGVTHGLMFTDVCETLYRITGKQIYQDYATYLYKAFSTYSINRSFNDLRYPFLMQKDSLFEGHAVHTYEHIRSVVNAYYNTGYPELKTAHENMLEKLTLCILPSGAGHGNEWIAKLKAHPTHTSSEYCTMVELRNSYGSLLQKTGNIEFADAAEKLTYNAMLSFRNKTGTALTYGKADNCYVLDGKHHHEHGEAKADPRFKYSPTHSEPAVCCVPNYGRNLSYFLEQMWMKTNDGIAVTMFGPSELTTEIDGTKVSIRQITNYPQSDEVTFVFAMDTPKEINLYLRKPNWTTEIISENNLEAAQNGFYKMTKEWENGDQFTIKFNQKIQQKEALNGEIYLQRGPLVYAYEISHREETIKKYADENFKDYYCFPQNEKYKDLKLVADAESTFENEQSEASFYGMKTFVRTTFFDEKEQKEKTIQLVPIGKTTLRKVTFPKH